MGTSIAVSPNILALYRRITCGKLIRGGSPSPRQSIGDYEDELAEEVIATRGATLVAHPPSPMLRATCPYTLDYDKLCSSLLSFINIRQRARESKYGKDVADEWPSGHTPLRFKKKYYAEKRQRLRDRSSVTPVEEMSPTMQAMTEEQREEIYFRMCYGDLFDHLDELSSTDGSEEEEEEEEEEDRGQRTSNQLQDERQTRTRGPGQNTGKDESEPKATLQTTISGLHSPPSSGRKSLPPRISSTAQAEKSAGTQHIPTEMEIVESIETTEAGTTDHPQSRYSNHLPSPTGRLDQKTTTSANNPTTTTANKRKHRDDDSEELGTISAVSMLTQKKARVCS